MQLIAEKEGTQRGSYAGALGYFSYDGNLDSCITLRTALVKAGHVHIQAGAGVVADSVPAAEYQETINKASALFKAITLADRIIQLEHPSGTIPRIRGHNTLGGNLLPLSGI